MKSCKINNNNRKDAVILFQFVTSYSILLIIILFMGMFLYQYGLKDAKNDLHKQNNSMLNKSAAALDDSISFMNTLATQISNNNSLRSLVKMDNTNNTAFHRNALDAMTFLVNFYPFETLLPIQDYYIYLPKVDYLLSGSTLSEQNIFYRYNKSFEQNEFSNWLAMMNSENNYRQFIDMKDYYQSDFNSFLYKVPMTTSYLTGKTDAIVCFEISIAKLKEMFSAINLFNKGFIVVTDNTEHKEVFRITSENTREDSISLLLSQIDDISWRHSKDYIEMKLNHDSVVVTRAQSKNGQWTYYLVQPSDLVFKELNSYQIAFFILIVITCIFCMMLIYYFSKRNMRPIIDMKTELASSMKQNDSLVLELEQQRPIIYNSYMSRIIKGMIANEQEAEEIKGFLGLNDTNLKYSILYASVYENQIEFYMEDTENRSVTDSKLQDYRETIRSYLYEYFGNDILIYEVSVNSFAILLTTDSSLSLEDSNQMIKSRFLELHNSLMLEHSIWIFGGLGNRNHQLSYLWKSYQQAMEAVSFIHEGHVFQTYMDIKRDKTSYYYPLEMAQQLSNFIHTGNEKQVHEIFRIIKKVNFDDVSLPISLIRWLLSDIRNTLLKVRFSIPATKENQHILDSIDAAFQESKTLDLMEEISIKLCSLHEKKAEGNRLIVNIQSYIKENYMDSSLSLKKISEVFDISESYFSYLFKAETKQNFSEYLELIRMDQAMILLKTTNINVSDMYLELGYNNANSFRRAFKKIHGVSPKMIREASLATEQEST
ncbi:MAG: AraC family transcriptional regulator [Clostridiales bacterium]|nr:AraC family transcriptional regulator [Clostridiales bacterium]